MHVRLAAGINVVKYLSAFLKISLPQFAVKNGTLICIRGDKDSLVHWLVTCISADQSHIRSQF